MPVPFSNPPQDVVSVARTSPTYDHVRDKYSWDLLTDLDGGTKAMRAAGRRWLPQEPAELDPLYNVRLARSFLFNAYSDTLDGLADRPFMKPVGVKGKLPPRLEKSFSRKSKGGRDLTELARTSMRMAVKFGAAHILVDYPKLPAGATLADERVAGDWPRYRVLDTDMIFWWDLDEEQNFNEIRWFEYHEKTVGIDKKIFERIWRVTKDIWQCWERDPSAQKDSAESTWSVVEETPNALNFVPIVSLVIGKGCGRMDAAPPLLDLAYTNLCHWQSSSDQRNALRFARIGILFGAGFDEEKCTKGFVLGPTQTIVTNNPEAKLSFVEHTGAAMGIGQKDIESLEAKMEVQGLQPLIEKSAQQSATGKEIDEARSSGSLMTWVRECEIFLLALADCGVRWTKEKISEDVRFDVFSDFSLSRRFATDVEALIRSRSTFNLSLGTFLREMRRRGVLSELTDLDEEANAVSEELATFAQQSNDERPGGSSSGKGTGVPRNGKP